MNIAMTIYLYCKLTLIEHSGMHQEDRCFEDLEYLNTINISYSKVLDNVKTRGRVKLPL